MAGVRHHRHRAGDHPTAAPRASGGGALGPATAKALHVAHRRHDHGRRARRPRIKVVGTALFPSDVHAEFDEGLWLDPVDFDAVARSTRAPSATSWPASPRRSEDDRLRCRPAVGALPRLRRGRGDPTGAEQPPRRPPAPPVAGRLPRAARPGRPAPGAGDHHPRPGRRLRGAPGDRVHPPLDRPRARRAGRGRVRGGSGGRRAPRRGGRPDRVVADRRAGAARRRQPSGARGDRPPGARRPRRRPVGGRRPGRRVSRIRTAEVLRSE